MWLPPNRSSWWHPKPPHKPPVESIVSTIKAAFWKAIRTDQVRPFVWVYYIALWIWGVYGTFFAAPVTYVEPVMGHRSYDLWIWLNIIGTTIVMAGLHLEDRAPHNQQLHDMAVRLQTAGHACMFFVLLAYEVSAISVTEWGYAGPGTYGIFVVLPYVAGCLLLTAQGVVKIVDRDGDL